MRRQVPGLVMPVGAEVRAVVVGVGALPRADRPAPQRKAPLNLALTQTLALLSPPLLSSSRACSLALNSDAARSLSRLFSSSTPSKWSSASTARGTPSAARSRKAFMAKPKVEYSGEHSAAGRSLSKDKAMAQSSALR
eukprot:CAMPEP_0204575854 /NCGR_PEP_ID=MMETSP0661-20131031/41439_1 /ASSEMBLY_ACC=CAM_ASM_000606 /TAXON_ID=109239 /ORGANISM="Alexandrium margalefi, Strain AMGDE01CS-322" /LENGTH=137 /DNA_ID=CAMNT_0051584539 /DNA_START=155 /DNA_END=566 /DNA_ORIENTATION=+